LAGIVPLTKSLQNENTTIVIGNVKRDSLVNRTESQCLSFHNWWFKKKDKRFLLCKVVKIGPAAGFLATRLTSFNILLTVFVEISFRVSKRSQRRSFFNSREVTKRFLKACSSMYVVIFPGGCFSFSTLSSSSVKTTSGSMSCSSSLYHKFVGIQNLSNFSLRISLAKKNNDLRHCLNSKMPSRHTFGLLCNGKQIFYFYNDKINALI
jgi:hypothetical protein